MSGHIHVYVKICMAIYMYIYTGLVLRSSTDNVQMNMCMYMDASAMGDN